MATETALKRVNVFPSEASYNTNKGSLGSDELALIPFVPSGLSSTSDISKGYIVFENGLIVQWGKYTSSGGEGNKSVNFNYPFPNQCDALVTQTDTYRAAMTSNVTKTGFTMYTYSDGYGYSWIAFGR